MKLTVPCEQPSLTLALLDQQTEMIYRMSRRVNGFHFEAPFLELHSLLQLLKVLS